MSHLVKIYRGFDWVIFTLLGNTNVSQSAALKAPTEIYRKHRDSNLGLLV